MDIVWSEDEVVLVIKKSELGQVSPEIVSTVWEMAMEDEKMGRKVGEFIVLGVSIIFQGVLQFLGAE